MAKVEFPKWMYHKTEAPKLVQNESELKGLGKDWKESPIEAEVKPLTPDEEVSKSAGGSEEKDESGKKAKGK